MAKEKHIYTSKEPAASDNPAEKVEGIVDNIIFKSEDSGYVACEVRLPGSKEKITVTGICAAIWSEETIHAEGKWINHPRYGRQFQADNIACYPPTSVKGIERYLAGGLIKGIRKAMAHRIVKFFGADTLRIIEKESQRLEEVEGIGPGRRKLIKDSWNEQKAVRDIMIFLRAHEIGTAQATRIYRFYGNNAVPKIRENPYRLCREIWGIGFKTADKVALSMGVPPDSELRARSGIIHVLQTLSDEGHCFCPREALLDHANNALDIDLGILETALEREVKQGHLVQNATGIYLPELFAAETGAAKNIIRMLNASFSFPPILIGKAIPWAEARMKIALDDSQANALKMALSNKVSIITGGPGVGKTTIIKALVDIFSARKLRIFLSAPTGRAAKRMEETTKHPTSTIHRMLKFKPHMGVFEFNEDQKLEGDVFILDEMSMVDILLANAFLSALPDHAMLIMVGDIDQLPSVGAGNVLGDLIDSRVIPCSRLETIFRQEEGSLIIKNAHRINHGEDIELPERSDDLSDFYFFQTTEPEDVIKKMLDLVKRHIPEKFGFSSMDDIQVLTPMRKNMLGADNLNGLLQNALNPSGIFISRFGRKYRKADRVMQIRNNYDKEVFNGDVGRISDIDLENQKLVVNYYGRFVEYDFNDLDELVHAYACSIHKSQGSEYPAIVILLATQHFKLLQRNLLYTAITRGKQLVCIVGTRKAMYIAIKNDLIRHRNTALADILAQQTKRH